jgi:uncharacterized protein (TIGR02246 family)
MLKFYLSLLSFIFFQSSFSQDKDIEILKKMNDDVINSALTTDTSVVAKIYADDMILINPAGMKRTRKELLDNATRSPVSAVHIDSLDVRLISNDVGIVTGYLTFTMSSGSGNVTGRTCYQDVYVKRKDRWYEVSAHVTSLK